MKIIHTSDWHLGRIIYGKSLLADQAYFIEHTFYELLEREQPDAIILAGDLFDRVIAPVEALRLYDRFVNHVCGRLHIPLIAVSGNHDGADRLGLGSGLLGAAGYHVTTALDTDAPPVILQKPGERAVHIYALPYFDPAMARDYLRDEQLRGFSQAYAAIVARIRARLDPAAFNILVAHCFVTGAAVSDSESPLFIGGSGETDATVFDGFDYVALGHLHRAQRAGANGRYAGSPLKYSFDEAGHSKSVTRLVIGQTETEICEIPVAPLRDMRVLSGTLDQLRERAAEDSHTDDYIFAELVGDPVFSPMEKLREVYPNALGVQNGTLIAELAQENRVGLKASGHTRIFEEFLRQMCGVEPRDEDMDIFEAAYAQALEEVDA